MKRGIAAIMIYLLLGLATSVLVAWLSVFPFGNAFEPERFVIHENEWKGHMNLRVNVADVELSHESNHFYSLEDLDSLDEERPVAGVPEWSDLVNPPATEFSEAKSCAAGWPLHCLAYLRVLDESIFIDEWDFRNHGALVGVNVFSDTPVDERPPSYLPVKPLWRGLVSNALYWALVWFILFTLMSFPRRWLIARRYRKGLCARCRYDRSKSDSVECPECGAHSDWRPHFLSNSFLTISATWLVLIAGSVCVYLIAFKYHEPYSMLHYAAYKGDVDRVRRELGRGGNVDRVDGLPRSEDQTSNDDRVTGLMLASHNGHLEVVHELLDADADTTLFDGSGFGVMFYAVASADRAILQMLLDAGASMTDESSRHSCLLLPAFQGDMDLFKFLIENGAQLEDESNAMDAMLFGAARNKHREIVYFLLDSRAKVTHAALSGAVQSGDLEFVKDLVARGGDIYSHNSVSNANMLVEAASGRAEETSRAIWAYLIAQGLDVNAPNNDGETALMRAAQNGNVGLCEFLLRNGANVNIVDRNSDAALDHALMFGHNNKDQLVQLLLRYGADPTLTRPDGSERFEFVDDDIYQILEDATAKYDSDPHEPDQRNGSD